MKGRGGGVEEHEEEEIRCGNGRLVNGTEEYRIHNYLTLDLSTYNNCSSIHEVFFMIICLLLREFSTTRRLLPIVQVLCSAAVAL